MELNPETLCFAWKSRGTDEEASNFYFYPDQNFAIESESRHDPVDADRPIEILVGKWRTRGSNTLVLDVVDAGNPFWNYIGPPTPSFEIVMTVAENADGSITLSGESGSNVFERHGNLPDRATKPHLRLETEEQYRRAGAIYDLKVKIVGTAVPSTVKINSSVDTDPSTSANLSDGSASIAVLDPGTYHISAQQFNNFSRYLGSVTIPQDKEFTFQCDLQTVVIRISNLPTQLKDCAGMAYLASADQSNRQGHDVQDFSEFEIETSRTPQLFLDCYEHLILMFGNYPDGYRLSVKVPREGTLDLDFSIAVPCAPIRPSTRPGSIL